MAIILLFGILMVTMTIYLWYLESKLFLSRMVRPEEHRNRLLNSLSYLGCFLLNIALFLRYGTALILDVTITIAMTSFLTMGTGVTGGIISLALSNGVSLILIKASQERR